MRFVAALPLSLLALSACSAAPEGSGSAETDVARSTVETARAHAGAVFTLDNAAAGNSVVAFHRAADGALTAAGSTPTGGLGTGAGLGSQGALAFAHDGAVLVAVNAGSNDVSTFTVSGTTLTPVARVASGGTMPIGVAVHDGLLYVLNAGTPNNVTGFRLAATGALTPIAKSTWPLSTDAAGPAQVGFAPDGATLVVTEKTTNLIDVITLDYSGAPVVEHQVTSGAPTPFGFAFSPRGVLVVSDAAGGASNAGALSSYVPGEGTLSSISAAVGDDQTAPCWVALSANGSHAYTANAHSGNVSVYSVGALGKLTFHSTVSSGTGAVPLDLALDDGSADLYSLDGGNHTITHYLRATDGSLTLDATTYGSLAASDVGIVAR